MTTEINKRPEWLRIIIGIFTAWVAFILSMAAFFLIVWVIQIKILDIEIVDIPAIIILLLELGLSVYISYRITKWQNKYLNKKSIKTSYIVLVLLIVLSFIAMPSPMLYTVF